MGIEFKINAEAGVIFSIATGHVYFADFQNLRDQLRAHPLLRSGLNHLADFRTASVRLTGEQAKIIAQWFRENRKVKKIAYVAISAFPYVRMVMGWVADSKNIEINVFHDMASARKWLGLPNEDDS